MRNLFSLNYSHLRIHFYYKQQVLEFVKDDECLFYDYHLRIYILGWLMMQNRQLKHSYSNLELESFLFLLNLVL